VNAAFDGLTEQDEAKRLLTAALAEGTVHAYLFHGPPGVGKRAAALAFAGALVGDAARAARRAHPDVYVLERLGEQIRIDQIRELRRDLHMRPFEASRRVYLLLDADTMNDDAADALLKDLEEPPPYAVIVLVADDIGPLPETIRSRCQLVPFRRLSERAVRAEIDKRAPELSEARATAVARLAAGRLDRVDRLLTAEGEARREALLEVARSVYADPGFDSAEAARVVVGAARAAGEAAKQKAEERIAELQLQLTKTETTQRLRRAAFGAEREDLLLSLEELAAWYRDLVAAATGAERVLVHYDRREQLVEDATLERLAAAERAAEIVLETWRVFEEFNLSPPLAFEALFVRLRAELGGRPSLV
jgi:DNA polymerase-3 subunit delta'